MELFLKILEIVGGCAFAVSGCEVAIREEMDLFGLCALGVTTAVGGGAVRDVILGATPPAMFTDASCVMAAFITCLILCIPKVRKTVFKSTRILLITDSAGLGIFTAAGTLKSLLLFPDNPFLAVFVGTITGVGGGIIRDIFANVRPYVFVRHFYANASILGSILFVLIYNRLTTQDALLYTMLFVFAVRCAASYYKWELPKFRSNEE